MATDDHSLMKEHYIKVSELMCQMINKTHLVWADLITHFDDYEESYNTNSKFEEATIYGSPKKKND